MFFGKLGGGNGVEPGKRVRGGKHSHRAIDDQDLGGQAIDRRVQRRPGDRHVDLRIAQTHQQIGQELFAQNDDDVRVPRFDLGDHRGYEVRPDVSRVADDKFRC